MTAHDAAVPLDRVAPAIGVRVPDQPLPQLRTHASLTLILLLGIVCMMDAAIVGALLSPIKTSLNLTDEQFARTAATFTIAGIVGAPLFGWAANRFGRKYVLLAGVVLWSLASIGSGVAAGLGALLIWRGLTGFGEAAYQGLAPSWLADLYGPKWRNLVFSLYMLRNKIGSALALAVGGWLAAHYDWQVAFMVAGIPGLILAVWLFFVDEPVPGAVDGIKPGTAPSRLNFREGLAVFRSTGYVLHCVALSLFFIGMSTQMWVPAYLYRVFSVPNKEATGFLAAVLLYTLPAGLIGGYLSSLFLRPVRGGFAGLLAVTSALTSVLFFEAYSTGDLDRAKFFIIIAVTTFGFSAGALSTLIVETVTPALRASASSFGALITGGVSGIVGPELIGILSDRYGLPVALRAGLAGYLLAALVWAGLALWLSRHRDS